MAPYARQPAIRADQTAIFEGYRLTVGDYVAEAWGWDEQIQQTGFWKHHPLEQFEVIEIDNAFAGGLHIVEDAGDYHIRMIYLLPAFQNRGIGARLITDIHTAARNMNKGLSLKVIHCNPASSLYERLGFVLTEEINGLKSMHWA